jgi:triosephosphate isomerase
MHKFIRETVHTAYGNDIAEVSILYGGSVKPENAKKFSLNQM